MTRTANLTIVTLLLVLLVLANLVNTFPVRCFSLYVVNRRGTHSYTPQCIPCLRLGWQFSLKQFQNLNPALIIIL